MPDAEGRPVRLQLRRTKGWRLPPNARSVARPTKWGNPYRVGEPPPLWPKETFTAEDAVECYRLMLAGGHLLKRPPGYQLVLDAVSELAGLDLACWCPLTYPDGSPYQCHADVLIRYSNG